MSKKCRSCGKYFDRVGAHWSTGDCTGPKLSSYQKELVEGMLLGDGWLSHRNKKTSIESKNV